MKRTSLIVTLVVLMSLMFVGLRFLPEARATTLYVGGGGPDNYTTIQAAIDDAFPGDVVYVYSGMYHENVLVNKTITLTGEDRNTTIIEPGGTGDIINVSADWVNITGFTIASSAFFWDSGLLLHHVKNCSVEGSIFSRNWFSLRVKDSEGNVIINNTFEDNEFVSEFFNSSHNRIVDNTIDGNNYTAINLRSSRNNTISGNYIAFNMEGLRLFGSDSNIISNNTIYQNGQGIYIEKSDGTAIVDNNVDSNWGGMGVGIGMTLRYSNRTHIVNNWIYNHWEGIVIYRSTLNNISNNGFTANWPRGIYLIESTEMTINGNGMVWDGSLFIEGDLLEHWNSHTISFNFIGLSGPKVLHYQKNSVGGTILPWTGQIILANCSAVVISDLTLSDVYAGIQMGFSSGNMITNTILERNYENIHLYKSSNNTIINSNITTGVDGIVLYSSSDNLIFHNNILRNAYQAHDDSPGTNQWDNGYPSGGNYWSDYSGVDELSGPNQDLPGADGLGDTPYSIPGGTSRDRYPLMELHKTYPSKPSAPLNLQATVSGENITLTWDPPFYYGGFPITNYSIYRGYSPGTIAFLIEIGNVTSYNDTGLQSGRTYYYQVTARNAKGEGPRSKMASAVIPSEPYAPRSLVAIGAYGRIELRWLPPVFDGGFPITNYTIYRGLTLGSEVFLVEIGNILNYTDFAVINGQRYYYRVAARNVLGEGPRSREATAVAGARPSEPRNLTATAKDRLVELSWSPPLYDGGLPVTNYRIFRGLVPSSLTLLVELGDVLNHTDLGLANGQTYYYEVCAKNQQGWGPTSATVSATPHPPPRAPAILYTNLTGLWLTDVEVTWLLSPDDGGGYDSVVAYDVRRSSNYSSNGSGYQLVGSVVNSVSVFTDLTAGVGDPNDYFYMVCAVDENNDTTCSTNQAGKLTYALLKGPNLVSVPLIQSDESIEMVLQTLSYDRVWSYDSLNREWKSYMKQKTYKGGLLNLNHMMGSWINVTANSNLTVAGIVPTQTTIHLHKGWNLVSFPSFKVSYTVADLKAEVPVERVEAFDSSAPPHFLRVLLDSDVLLAGQGYWVKASEDATWVVSNT